MWAGRLSNTDPRQSARCVDFRTPFRRKPSLKQATEASGNAPPESSRPLHELLTRSRNPDFRVSRQRPHELADFRELAAQHATETPGNAPPESNRPPPLSPDEISKTRFPDVPSNVSGNRRFPRRPEIMRSVGGTTIRHEPLPVGANGQFPGPVSAGDALRDTQLRRPKTRHRNLIGRREFLAMSHAVPTGSHEFAPP